jgi:nicotinate phosphoribosyltransferase
MGTSADRPYLDGIYKLCETQTPDGKFQPIMKLSKDKNTLPGRKQVYRFTDPDGNLAKDVIALADEPAAGLPLLVKVMEKGKLTYKLPTLGEIRLVAAENLRKIHQKYHALTGAPTYPVELSQKLSDLAEALKRQITQNEINHGHA